MLDVNQLRWHDDFNAFKAKVKDLELMLSNIITHSFITIGSLRNRLELLQNYNYLSKTTFIKKIIEKCTIEFYNCFLNEINEIKRKLDYMRQNPPKGSLLPQRARLAWHALMLRRRLHMNYSALERCELPEVSVAGDVEAAIGVTNEAIDGLLRNTHKEWFDNIDINLPNKLNNNLLIKDPNQTGFIQVHFF